MSSLEKGGRRDMESVGLGLKGPKISDNSFCDGWSLLFLLTSCNQ